MKNENVLCMFIKAPRMGAVKTRMQPEIAPAGALRLYRAMTEDLLDRFAGRPDIGLVLFFWPPGSRGDVEQWLGRDVRLVEQSGADLGARMHNAFMWAYERRFAKTVIIGSDTPTLDGVTIDDAFARLDAADVVLGPCSDGGYYLIGLKRPCRELFEGIAWSGADVCANTRIHINRAGLLLAELGVLNDLDTGDDVRAFLRDHGSAEENAGMDRTLEVVRALPGFGSSRESG